MIKSDDVSNFEMILSLYVEGRKQVNSERGLLGWWASDLETIHLRWQGVNALIYNGIMWRMHKSLAAIFKQNLVS